MGASVKAVRYLTVSAVYQRSNAHAFITKDSSHQKQLSSEIVIIGESLQAGKKKKQKKQQQIDGHR